MRGVVRAWSKRGPIDRRKSSTNTGLLRGIRIIEVWGYAKDYANDENVAMLLFGSRNSGMKKEQDQ